MSDTLDYDDLIFISQELGVTLTAALSGTRNRNDVEAWLDNKAAPSAEQVRRVSFACDTFRKISESQGADVTRSWFIGANVGDNDDPPVTAIREDRFEEVRISASRIINDEWS